MGILFFPDNPLAMRMYQWLEKQAEARPAVTFPREMLVDLAIKSGSSKEAAWSALKNLEEVTNVAFFWDSADRTVYYAFIPMTPEDKLKRIEDELWFDSLPDHVPKKDEQKK